MTKKKCSTCKVEKRLNEFNKDSKNKDGHRYNCRLCQYKSQLKHLRAKIKEMEVTGESAS